jgi:hypothetical protein
MSSGLKHNLARTQDVIIWDEAFLQESLQMVRDMVRSEFEEPSKEAQDTMKGTF